MQLTLLYLLPFLISTAISLGVGAYCWRRQAETGAMMYALVAFSQASWTFGYIFELLSSGLESKIFWDNFQFVGGVGWLMAFVAFTLDYTGRPVYRPGLIYGLLFIPGGSIVLLAFTDSLHRLIRPQIRLVPGDPFSALSYDMSLPIWLWGIYGYIVAFACIILLFVKYMHSQPLYRTQIGSILAGNLMPLIGTMMTLSGIIQGTYRDITPFTFAIGNLIVAWGLFRYRLFDIVPLAWDKVIENMTDAVVVLNDQRRVVNLNPAARMLAGLENAAVIGLPTSQVFADWPEIVEKYKNVKEARAEMEVHTAIGPRFLELRIQPLFDQGKRFKGRVVIARDITDPKRVEDELKQHRDHLEDIVRERTAELIAANQQLHQQIIERERLEEQLRQSQKLEAVGQLAGGIAHDFNNLLVPIIGYADLSLINLAPDAKLYADLMQIKTAALRAAGLTRQILAFSRQQVLELKVLDFNVIIEEFKKMLQSLIGEDIELRTFLAPSLYRIKADRGQIEQVLLNLAVNSRDAMPKGGRLIIETINVFLDEAYAKKYTNGMAPGLYVMLAVSDTGLGMDADIQKRIFDPFFTTKERGKGTGLGLATVFGIIKQHEGNICIYSQPGCGTTVKIYLPKAEEYISQTTSPQISDSTQIHGTETVLVVEDEEMVRRLVCESLEAHGYDVVEAKSPADCLELASGKAVIDLLLTDVIMPGMDGKELFLKLAAIHPNCKVLYMSGYAHNVIGHHGIMDESVDFLQKPFTTRALARKVRDVLI
jgi:PAS domain S-box-containing protein